MKLTPTAPPGRITRKARAFTAEILQLRHQGYTFEAIRAALASAGVHVSHSTVQREVARAAGRPTATTPEATATSRRDTSPQPSKVASFVHPTATRASPAVPHDVGAPRLAGGLRGKESAEAFFTSHEINPLFPAKETP